MTPSAAVIEGLRFLHGTWRGEGTYRGVAVTTRSTAAPFAGEMIRLDVETSDASRVVHRERIVFKPDAAGRVTASTSPWRGDGQAWTVEEAGPGAWTLHHPGLRWTIRRTPEGYEESFGVADPAGGVTPVVVLRHRRDEDLPQ